MYSWATMFCAIFAALLSIFYLFDSLLQRKYRTKSGCALPPGPWGLPILGHLHLLGNLPHQSLQKLAQKFGPIMYIRLGLVPTIVISSPETAELILRTHDAVFANRPKVQAAEYMWYGRNGVIFGEYGSRWRNLRKLCTLHLLSGSKIESMKSMRSGNVRGVIRQLVHEAQARNVINLSAKVGSLLEDMTFQMVIGRCKDDIFDLRLSIEEIVNLTGAFNIADYLPFIGAFDPQGFVSRMKTLGKVMDGFLENVMDEHVRDVNTREDHQRDFIDEMLSVTEPIGEKQEKLDRTSIKAIAFDMIAGSFDTTSTTVQWIFSELLKNPRVMKKVQLELENVVSMDRMVEESDLVKLDYLELVIKESMRLHPVGPFLAPHESMEDVTINGYYIPKKSRIIVNIWAIGRDPHVWSANVNEFYPERFIGASMDFHGQDSQFIPFGLGRRGCAGVQLGLKIVRLVTAQLVHCFNWELPDGMSPDDIDMDEKFGLTLGRASHLHAKPTFRLRIDKL